MSLTITFQGRKFELLFEAEHSQLGDEWTDTVTLRQLAERLSSQCSAPVESIKLLASGGEASRHNSHRSTTGHDPNRPINTGPQSGRCNPMSPRPAASTTYSSPFSFSGQSNTGSHSSPSSGLPQGAPTSGVPGKSSSHHTSAHPHQHPSHRDHLHGQRANPDRNDGQSITVSAWGKITDFIGHGTSTIANFLDRLDGSSNTTANTTSSSSSSNAAGEKGSWVVMLDMDAPLSFYGLHTGSRVMMLVDKRPRTNWGPTPPSTSSSQSSAGYSTQANASSNSPRVSEPALSREECLLKRLEDQINHTKTVILPMFNVYKERAEAFLATSALNPGEATPKQLQDEYACIGELLLQCLLKIDDVQCESDETVLRAKRREAVRFVQGQLDITDALRERVIAHSKSFASL
ncbi:hypothetical protein BASA50_010025 [Batrachochytrium salamandrivorans]|uniref:BAG domain-containing protein n=1 Tax=Batrachochytrium salamandrivorans TaxID=1357716 RepID=A0ABQ8F0Q4_9FUNG|nr:hypothetical protein BASA60_010983 [Batrachochytrium salamandrivorans]KAH6568941.1 hypothetical protein BASA62_005181 [Batrachochytrium salamandrivorans]KAH6589454.1 hypothetical protein BASA50_010025 [Batrachochytrium salamandrivorans]KAH6595049.1 hypothetical protein BASA61_003879 [Batrachochytrium salamandrivorans]KAH9276104.1 hypothetical protein BASA83_001377 [Batrachochytrium salamandrivorans]